MNKRLQTTLLRCVFLLLFVATFFTANATHIIGGELYYTWISGNTYKVTLGIYGDCNLNPGATFLTLPSSTPVINVYNNNTSYTSMTLSLSGPGVEVTPVCPGQVNNTTCVSTAGSVPGIKRYLYTSTITLPYSSTNWRFVFAGNMGPSTSAGRSGQIFNILPVGVMGLEATLNNASFSSNSSPVYSTVPTPFFCINKPANYNPGAVDPESDNLTIALVSGLDATTSPLVPVTYKPAYSATAPLDVVAGSMSFNSTNGQFAFTPSMANVYLVVYKVTETRNGITVGTSMREMNFMILPNCNNNPPGGGVSSGTISGGTMIDSTSVKVCASQGLFTFNINGSDLDGNNINMSVAGLPSGATMNITGNNTANPVGHFSWNVSNVAPGTYTFYITYIDDGCPLSSKQTIAYNITVLAKPTMTFTITQQATCTQKAKFNITPGVSPSPWTVTVTQGTTTLINKTNVTGTITDSLPGGTYTFTVKNANGCQFDTTINLPEPPKILANVLLTKPPCNHFQNGSITVSAYNSTPPYQYALGTGPFTSSGTFTGLYSGNYTVHIKNADGCVTDTLINLPDSVKIKGSAVVANVLCNGGNNGSVTINATGAYPPYTYSVNSGSYGSSSTFTPLTAGTYTFHVRDTELCYFDTSITITQPTPLTVNAVVTNITCNGANNGTVTLTGGGGVTPYKYAKDAGTYSTTATFNGLTPGTYIFHVKDSNNCVKDTTITITQPLVLGLTVATDTPSCNGSTNGAFTITGSGGTTPYTYAIGAGAFGSTNTFGSLAAGTYTLHIKDANSCTKDTTITLVQPVPVTVALGVKNSTCSPISNGKVTVYAGGGTSPYQYANGTSAYSTSNAFTPLAAGSYTFHIKDAKGCIKDTTMNVIDSIVVTGTVAINNATCYNVANGSMTITPGGGVSPYTYALNTNPYSSGATISNILAGTYTVHIKDALGCIKDTNVQVTQPTVIAPSVVTLTQPSCYGGSNGSMVFSASGGTPAYTYALGTGSYSSVSTFTNLTAGTYTLHVKDNNGCTHDTVVTLGQPTPLAFTLVLSNNKCFGDASGQVQVNATGGTPAYVYAADNSAFFTANVLTGLYAGSHAIHLKDNNGCLKDTSITLTQPTKLTMSAAIVNPTCEGFKDGKVTLGGLGGVSPYTFAMGSGSFGAGNVFGSLPESNYTFHVKDANGCISDSTLALIGFPHIVYDKVVLKEPSCYNFRDGSITFNMKGGIPPFTYTSVHWAIFPTDNHFDSLKSDSYHIIIKDSTGCKKDTTIALPQPDKLVVNPVITPNDCKGYDDGGGVFADVTGGTTPYFYLWSTGNESNSPRITGMPNGTYQIWVRDANNCKDSATAIVAYDDCCKPFIPDAFTPNHDNHNDQFHILYKGDFKLEEFSVYNRYGNRLFYTIHSQEGWDGTFNGVEQETGVYFYYIKGVCGNSGKNIVEYKGDVTLLR